MINTEKESNTPENASQMKKPTFHEPNIFKAIEKGKLNSVQYLVEVEGIDVNSKDDKNQELTYDSATKKL